MHTPNVFDCGKRRIPALDQAGQAAGNKLIFNHLQPSRRLGMPFTHFM
jgi:hypothetical protein